MGDVRVLEVKRSVFAENDRRADALRDRLKREGVFLLNLMSSPGAGKTTILRCVLGLLQYEGRIVVDGFDAL